MTLIRGFLVVISALIVSHGEAPLRHADRHLQLDSGALVPLARAGG